MLRVSFSPVPGCVVADCWNRAFLTPRATRPPLLLLFYTRLNKRLSRECVYWKAIITQYLGLEGWVGGGDGWVGGLGSGWVGGWVSRGDGWVGGGKGGDGGMAVWRLGGMVGWEVGRAGMAVWRYGA